MSYFRCKSVFAIFLTIAVTLSFQVSAEHVERLPGMDVEGRSQDTFSVQPDTIPPATPSVASFLRRVPGANVNLNGPLTGIAQYRGMFGDRVNVLMDGVNIIPGGPNAMDAPLNYLPAFRAESITVIRGIAPVSSGIETIGGTIIADTKLSEFSESENWENHGRLDAGGHSVDSGYGVSGLTWIANNKHRLHAAASREDGNDRRFPGGQIDASSHDRNSFDVGYGFLSGDNEWSVDYRRNDTNETGTPSLPMDIMLVDSDLFRTSYRGNWQDIGIEAGFNYNYVDHVMNNFTLRPAMPGMRRFTSTDVYAYGYQVKAFKDIAGGLFTFGADGDLAKHNALINDPDNPVFFVENFNDAQRDRFGTFLEWSGPLADRLGAEVGVRYTRVNMNSGTVDGTPAQLMMGPGILRDRFNAADRSQSDNNFDWMARLRYALTDYVTVELGGARKTRSPSYQERYLWLPLESTGGMADGRRYVGDVNLDPEVAHQVELGIEYVDPRRFYFSPRVFYHHVDDYIQGTPVVDPVTRMVAAANGDLNPLQFSNVEAKLYGADVEWGWYLSRTWHLYGTVSYVRGKRRDIDDNLYRIAPLNGTVALSYEKELWSLTAESMFYASQDQVSATNLETKSPGYGLLNLYGSYKLRNTGLSYLAGIENVLDKEYQPHLNGLNRVTGSDVLVGERVPGDGISGFVRASFEW